MSAPSRPPPDAAVRSEPEPADPVDALAIRLGVRIPDHALALAALTHKSYVNEHRDEPGLTDNERLEFLGDAVIDLAVSHRLMARFPGAREGELSKMRAAVVDEQGLAEMARGLDLGSLLRVGRGEELTGGRKKASLLSDAMEAVIAAVFLSQGLEPVLGMVDRFLGVAFARAAAGTLDRDYKTQLQEIAQSRHRATPRYRVIAEHGPDHSKVFEVETDLRGEVLGRGAGRSKKDAEQAAAKVALEELGRRVGEAATTPPAAYVTPSDAPVLPPAEVAAPLPPAAEPPPVVATAAEGDGALAPPAEHAPPMAPAAEASAPPAPVRRRRAALARAAAAKPASKRTRSPARGAKAPSKRAPRGTRAKR